MPRIDADGASLALGFPVGQALMSFGFDAASSSCAVFIQGGLKGHDEYDVELGPEDIEELDV